MVEIINGIMAAVTIVGLIVLACVLSHESGQDGGREKMQREAITNGCAEYYLDAHFDRQWRWKSHKQ